MRQYLPGFVVLAMAAPLLAIGATQRVYHLEVGDPARRDREVPVVLDAIVDTATGETFSPSELPARLRGVRLLLVGETHTSLDAHRVQLGVLQALQASGRPVLVGLEMFPYTQQRFLDEWREGLYTEDGFVKLAGWYEHWGYSWRYYRDIFLFARDHRIPMYAVNTPREVVTAVRKKGLANLTPEEASRIPSRIDLDSAEHMTFFKASFEEGDTLHGGFSEDAWKGMLAAQATWDASMGWNAVRALEAHGTDGAVMVVLAGSGHVAYGLGIERQVRQWFEGGVASIVPVPTRDDDGQPLQTVRASYANYVWGIPHERGGHFPALGVSTREAPDSGGLRQVMAVSSGSVAARAGFEVNDVILSMDGTAAHGRDTLNRLIATKNWGDTGVFVVRRGGAEITLTAHFRRVPETEKPGSR